jgi:hypothetical protein
MGQATESHYACVFVVSEDVVDTATWPGLLVGPIQKGSVPSG